MEINIIVAMAQNRAIGKDNKLLWSLPIDMRHFKEKTIDSTVVMGRKTSDSLRSALPNRLNVVLTRDRFEHRRALFYYISNLESSIKTITDCLCDKVWIIGGEQIYKLALDTLPVNNIWITEVKAEIGGDCFFPELDLDKYIESSRTSYKADEKHQYDFDIIHYVKRSLN